RSGQEGHRCVRRRRVLQDARCSLCRAASKSRVVWGSDVRGAGGLLPHGISNVRGFLSSAIRGRSGTFPGEARGQGRGVVSNEFRPGGVVRVALKAIIGLLALIALLWLPVESYAEDSGCDGSGS